ncbi:MAG: hypothetical protein Q7T78_16950 [Rhodoferax sp.]|nr:hypothetical protein [Rhodoferax sp.]
MIQDDYGNLVHTPGIASITARLDDGDARMTRIEASQVESTQTMESIQADLAANTQATKEVAASTSELVDILNALKGAFRTLDFIGKLARPLGYIVSLGAAVAGVWAAFRHGSPR